MRSLADEPRPRRCEKLSGQERYRVRQGAYRIIYEINDDAVRFFSWLIGKHDEDRENIPPMLKPNLPGIDDEEGKKIPGGLPLVVDAHVHIFPSNIFSAIWAWFDENAWPIRYRLSTSAVLGHLLSHGVSHVIALQYAHKPGISRMLNQYMVEKCREFPGRVTGMAAVFPGEENVEEILKEAFDNGLKGVKLHAHVQCFDMNAEEMDVIYDLCESEQKPIVMHVGREPKSGAYRCDPDEICSAEKLESVLQNFPKLRICVPHLGFDEIFAYKKLIEKYDNLWLDTTMILADYFPITGLRDSRFPCERRNQFERRRKDHF